MRWPVARAALFGTLAAVILVGLGAVVVRAVTAQLQREPLTIRLPESGPEPAAAAGGAPNVVNLNTAGQAELETLSGIGPARARRIIESRTDQGPFASPDDLVTRGIVPASVLDHIRDAVTVGP